MPKKTRRMKQRASMRRSVESTAVQETEQEQVTSAPVAQLTPSVRPLAPVAPRAVSPATFDYSYIYGDLKRIALFASFFFVVLILLAVFVIK